MRAFVTRCLTSVAVVGTLVAALAPGAQAAPAAQAAPPHSVSVAAADNPCGPGYGESDRAEIRDGSNSLFGTVVLYWNGTYQSNCTVTYKSAAYGVVTRTNAYVCRQSDGKCSINDGGFRYEADTDPLKAPGCVRWGGLVTGIDGRVLAVNKPWGHC